MRIPRFSSSTVINVVARGYVGFKYRGGGDAVAKKYIILRSSRMVVQVGDFTVSPKSGSPAVAPTDSV